MRETDRERGRDKAGGEGKRKSRDAEIVRKGRGRQTRREADAKREGRGRERDIAIEQGFTTFDGCPGQDSSGACNEYRGTSLTRNSPTPLGHHRALGIVLL